LPFNRPWRFIYRTFLPLNRPWRFKYRTLWCFVNWSFLPFYRFWHLVDRPFLPFNPWSFKHRTFTSDWLSRVDGWSLNRFHLLWRTVDRTLTCRLIAVNRLRLIKTTAHFTAVALMATGIYIDLALDSRTVCLLTIDDILFTGALTVAIWISIAMLT
jgi:hypothetical protein